MKIRTARPMIEPGFSNLASTHAAEHKSEFKLWLHVFAVKSYLGRDSRMIVDTLKIAPWIFQDQRIDREMLLSLYRLGAMKHMPQHWSRGSWDWLEPDPPLHRWSGDVQRFNIAREVSPIYACLVEGLSGGHLIRTLEIRGAGATGLDFWKAMEPLIILPAFSGDLIPRVVTKAVNAAELANKINQEIDRS